MTFIRRATLVSITVTLAAVGLSACGGGGGGGTGSVIGGGSGGGSGGVPPVNRAPLAANDVIRADGAALNTINVLANDSDPDGDALTVTVEEQAPVGTVSVNADKTVRIASLPTGFKGVTRFKYKVADAAGLSAVASAAVFVGADPFRVVFVGDAASNGSNEVYLTNFAAPPVALSAATEGTLKLKGFVAAPNGSTVVYRRADSVTPATQDLSFVQTATPAVQVRVALPTGTALVQDAQGQDQFGVSPNGQWIVFIARDAANSEAAYVLNVASPATVSKVIIPGAGGATVPRFSSDSLTLYLLASATAGGTGRALYAAALGTSTVKLLSAPSTAFTDDVLEYSVATDQARILLRANRGGVEGLYYIDPTHLQTEVQVSHTLGLLGVGETLRESTINLPPGGGGSVRDMRVGYTTQTLTGYSTYVAEVSATPNPRKVAIGRVVGFRPDDLALLYQQTAQISEVIIDSGAAGPLVGSGASGFYDSTGNIVLLQQFLPYQALAVTLRGAFSSSLPVGTAGMAAQYFDLTGFDRAVLILGEGPTSGAAAVSGKLALVNAVAPNKLLYLADFSSPLTLSTRLAQVVN